MNWLKRLLRKWLEVPAKQDDPVQDLLDFIDTTNKGK